MGKVINIRQLRSQLSSVVQQVRAGERFTVLYRSRPAFRIVPVDDLASEPTDLQEDPLYRAAPLGKSASGDVSKRHDEILYS